MANPAFDAALLLRGLRAMDAALGESYNVLNHTCIPAPVVYSSEFPQEGIDFSKYQGIEGIKGTWRNWMYEDGGQGKLKNSVHEDVEATVVEAFGILEKCDKSKEGLVTTSEWEACQKGKSAEDQKWDLEYLLALNNVTGKMLVLEKDQPLNPADPNTYPELIKARADAKKAIEDKDGQISTLETDLGASRDIASFYQKMSYGLGGGLGLVALLLGVRAIWRSRQRPLHPEAKNAIAQQQTEDKPAAPKAEKGPPAIKGGSGPKPARNDEGPKVVKDTTGPVQGGSKPPAKVQTVAVADDIAEALMEIDSNKSPAGGTKMPSTPPLTGGVTPENVIISGPNAEPVSGMDPHVIRAQIVLTFRHFLSQTAREALLSGKALPAEADLVNSAFTERVNEMVDAVMREYHKMGQDALSEMWQAQREDRGYITRRGAPQRLILSACGEFIEADAVRAQSPFAGGAGAGIRAEAERRAGETDFFEKGMREILKDPARLGR